MSIEHICPSCQIRLRVADESAGKKVRCKCGAVSLVAAPSPPAASHAQATGSPQSIVVTCATCHQALRAPHSAAGKAVKCKCGQVVHVPGGPAAPATPTLASPRATTTSVPSAKPAAKPVPKPTAAARPAAAPARPVAATATAVAPRQAAPARMASTAAPGHPRAAAQPASTMGSMFDELTEADWHSESPIKRAYAPPAVSQDGAVLRKFVGQELKSTSVHQGAIPGTLIALSVINFIFGALYIVGGIAIIALVQMASVVEQLQEVMPALQLGAWIACAYLLFWGIFDVVLGVGLLQRSPWGWCVAGVGYAFAPVCSLYNVVTGIMAMGNDINPPRIVGMIFGMGVTIAITAYVYKGSTRNHFGLKSLTPVIICAIIGVLLGVAMMGAFALLDQTAESMIPADADAG